MWPDQQPPGGAQNPQQGPGQQDPGQQNPGQRNPEQPNPYQQPGYQQHNPYQQQPGASQYPQAGAYGQQQPGPAPYGQQPAHPYGQQQPNPYGRQPQWGQPPTVSVPGPPQGGGGNTKLIAIIAATAVVVAAGVTGFLVLGGSKDDKADGGKDDKRAGQSPTTEPSPDPVSSGPEDNPRGNETEKPTVAGWKVVVNAKWGIAFDVPASWQVQSPGLYIGFDFENQKEKAIVMSGTAEYQPKWCTSDDDKDGRTEDTPLAVVGTKGAGTAKNTDQIALANPPWWVFGGYTDPDKKSLSWDKKATPFTTASGIKGSYAWARSTNTPRKGKCVTDGKALTFGFRNSTQNFVSFNFFGAKGIKEEVSQQTILKILGTVRLHGTPTNE
ncbi:hypothetical protein NX794_05505 [Streptomyces sp. LP11]|uniref:DUF8017 domain-containing protein n=1 Tax=Streptomyces pyxinicus TaxID=2970331 RepID=A0ABT2AWR9_9ACTN|nr:hypothetical protein [Streptomyces sp. LP11]MCS0600689.1 hypothetical protein [Streptomyces sp. LP11]